MRYVFLAVLLISVFFAIIALTPTPRESAKYHDGYMILPDGLLWNMANATGACSRQPVYRTGPVHYPLPKSAPYVPYPVCP